MDAASNDLTRPLGLEAEAPTRWASLLARWPFGTIAASAAAIVIATGIVYAAFFGDSGGGVPRAEVAILRETKPAAPPAVPVTPTAVPVPPAGGVTVRAGLPPSSSGDAQAAPGMPVTRPAGPSMPMGVVIRVPDSMLTELPRAPDPRLSEASRYGVLPRLGPEGLRALDVYRRQPGAASTQRRVAIVVGGLGVSASATADAIAKLPEPVTLAFGPYGPDVEALAARARAAGHEIMLQVPMEPFDYPDSDPGPHTLLTTAQPAENIGHLHWAMGRFAGYVGLVNFMGGKLTADGRVLAPLLREAGARGLGFLDDGSSARSQILAVAGETPAARAEIVIDAVARGDAIDKALERLEAAATPGMVAIGFAGSLPVTLERIARWSRGLEARGIHLVPASAGLLARPQEAAKR